MNRLAALLAAPLAVAALLGGGPALAADGEQVPQVGRDGPDMDACGGVGRVSRVNPTGDGLLPVFPLPSDQIRPKDRLVPDTLVWLCDAQGDWQGIVYASGQFQELGDCRVSSPVAAPQAYSGPCRSGWVPAKFLYVVAD